MVEEGVGTGKERRSCHELVCLGGMFNGLDVALVVRDDFQITKAV